VTVDGVPVGGPFNPSLTQVPIDYTGGSHRAMGIMPPSRRGE